MNKMLYLKNIGIIKEANINLNSLCIVAGENDSGKSTIGKILMALIKTHNISKALSKKYKKKWHKEKEFDKLSNLLFDGDLKENGEIYLKENDKNLYNAIIGKNGCLKFESDDFNYLDCTFIQSPLVWDLFDFFRDVRLANDGAKIYGGGYEISYPYLLWDLYQKIEQNPLKEYDDFKSIKEEITAIIQGHFLKSNKKTYKFYRNNNEISLKNVAIGIKQFGILQALINNNRITSKGFLIFDEPENHLHPTWQIVFAKLLVRLSAKKIPILINTHSPYIIEAIYKYSLSYKNQINFHLSIDGVIKQYENNEKTMEMIFEKLNKPFETFDRLDEENGRS
ncbi:ATP-binding protein [Campylobacter lari]|uniref:ATP-binding protein n=1 Tax=Campylobacter sp. FU_497 TaxID=2911610 RepID=UPI0021E6410C|nr:ATP-binding protein [Campylobacter sp. FU_497]MCV3411292.1 ATP-binding protein [Campylobacter lari]MCV3420192.1 ATP-binding protein [Campylobacter lari]MCV3451292.1 ATP-binding protein [Campylobacter lari]MCV3463642.1 ATP-binding protein [Campylobacter sp. FU_497]HEC1759939.1 ATP-binding protein [Campylobacter lari]